MNQNLLASRYRIIQKLGSGGFGDTFLAEDTHLPSGRTCVIKQLRPMNNNPQVYQLVKERFQREAVILENLGNSHQQIPALFAYFEHQGQFYLVQEYVQGETLSTFLKKQGKQSEAFVKEFLTNLLVVLEYIQTKRVIHRDIKPDNIIIRQSDGTPVLIDFGAIRETIGTEISPSGNSTRSIVIGTPGFMPPEQAIGRPVFSSDLYALGLTAIYLLTGKIPQELKTEPLTGEILWRQDDLNVSPMLANVIERSIKPQAEQRFATAQLMRHALQEQPTVSIPQPSFPSLQQPILSSKPNTPNSNWLKIIFAAGTMGITFLAGWAFFSREQPQLGEKISKNQLVNPTPEISNTQQPQQNQAEPTPEKSAGNPRQPQQQPQQNQTFTPSSEPTQIPNTQQSQQNQAEPTPEKSAENPRQPQQQPQQNQTFTPSSEPTSLTWRSKSNLTRIAKLNQICFGTSTLSSVQTVFGYGKLPFTGTITISSPQTGGCATGDTLEGNFELSRNADYCVGAIKITWQNSNNAFIEWSISNLGSACPVGTNYWKINTYPVQL